MCTQHSTGSTGSTGSTIIVRYYSTVIVAYLYVYPSGACCGLWQGLAPATGARRCPRCCELRARCDEGTPAAATGDETRWPSAGARVVEGGWHAGYGTAAMD